MTILTDVRVAQGDQEARAALVSDAITAVRAVPYRGSSVDGRTP